MSTRRVALISQVPAAIKRAFRLVDPPTSGEERLWRERAARMTLDALGYTNLTMKPHEHNAAVTYARRWFRGMYDEAPQPDNVLATFDSARIPLPEVREAVLAAKVALIEIGDEDAL